MPSNVTAKIKSAPRSVFVLLFFVIVGYLVIATQTTKPLVIRSGGFVYTLALADTPTLRTQGLGDRSSLPTNQGMLFSYPNQDIRCFWMRDMHFSLDMIWLNAQHQVVHLAERVNPGSYPHTFCSSGPAQYVIELNAGQTARSHIHMGQILNF